MARGAPCANRAAPVLRTDRGRRKHPARHDEPNFLILEGIEDWSGFHAEIFKSPIRWEAGYVIPSDAPGIGVELKETVAEAHPYVGESLQLKMQDRPA